MVPILIMVIQMELTQLVLNCSILNGKISKYMSKINQISVNFSPNTLSVYGMLRQEDKKPNQMAMTNVLIQSVFFLIVIHQHLVVFISQFVYGHMLIQDNKMATQMVALKLLIQFVSLLRVLNQNLMVQKSLSFMECQNKVIKSKIRWTYELCSISVLFSRCQDNFVRIWDVLTVQQKLKQMVNQIGLNQSVSLQMVLYQPFGAQICISVYWMLSQENKWPNQIIIQMVFIESAPLLMVKNQHRSVEMILSAYGICKKQSKSNLQIQLKRNPYIIPQLLKRHSFSK
ncbi:unnamed protein product [Paramecium octaurelia]|uniref:Transmembrane protein n=1 Tax=Paramecium octaurelia TaxID=43137 RepID=A0A8S1W9Q6_PAROT|nr:unnamed protein product [Paramecium octaurelia]